MTISRLKIGRLSSTPKTLVAIALKIRTEGTGIGAKGRILGKSHSEDFKDFIQEDFKREPEIYLDINYPCFGQWLWTNKVDEAPLSTAWGAVIGGTKIESENGSNFFSVSLTLFLFDVNSKKRLWLQTGESVLEFVFEKKSDERGCWRNLGWVKDGNYEWENIEWEDFKW